MSRLDLDLYDNTSTTKVARRGLSFSSVLTIVLTIVFIVLKLCKVISWSWFWVLSPVIFEVGLGLLIGIIAVIVMCIANKR